MPDGSSDPLDRLLELASIPPPTPLPPEPEPQSGTPPDVARLLPILCCPETAQRLTLADDGSSLKTEDGRRTWPRVAGRPNLFPGLEQVKIHAESHLSNPLDQS